MKRRVVFKIYGSAIAIISALSVAVSPTVDASEIALNSTIDSTRLLATTQTSAVNLVYLADRGYFSDRGIPGSQALISAYSLGNIGAEKLVQVGVETGRVSTDRLQDRQYISAVESMLNNLKTR